MKKPKIAMYCNQLDNRGTGRALYDYAHVLRRSGYQITIVTQHGTEEMHPTYKKFVKREFDVKFLDEPTNYDGIECDVFYKLCSGGADANILHSKARNCVHAVFEKAEVSGDNKVAYVSDWLAKQYDGKSVPHIMYANLGWEPDRTEITRPSSQLVVGRSGGYTTFDIPWVKEAVIELVLEDPGKFVFKFLNTEPFSHASYHDVIQYLPYIETDYFYQYKMAEFVNECDVMLHARMRGETFGISVGEFAMRGKAIVTYGDSPEKAHTYELTESKAEHFPYLSKDGLKNTLRFLQKVKEQYGFLHERYVGYTKYSDKYCVEQFEKVFLQ